MNVKKHFQKLIKTFPDSGKSMGAGLGIVFEITRNFGRIKRRTGTVLLFLYDEVSLLYARVILLSLRPFWRAVFTILLTLSIKACFFVSMVVYANDGDGTVYPTLIENRMVYVIPGDNNDSVIVTEYDIRTPDGIRMHRRHDTPIFRFPSQADFENYKARVAFLESQEEKRRWWIYSQSQSHRAISGTYPSNLARHGLLGPFFRNASAPTPDPLTTPAVNVRPLPEEPVLPMLAVPELSVLELPQPTLPAPIPEAIQVVGTEVPGVTGNQIMIIRNFNYQAFYDGFKQAISGSTTDGEIVLKGLSYFENHFPKSCVPENLAEYKAKHMAYSLIANNFQSIRLKFENRTEIHEIFLAMNSVLNVYANEHMTPHDLNSQIYLYNATINALMQMEKDRYGLTTIPYYGFK